MVYGMIRGVRFLSAHPHSTAASFQDVQHWKRELLVVAGGSSGGGVVGKGDGTMLVPEVGEF